MRSLRGFAAQAIAAYGKLNSVIAELVPTVGRLSEAWRGMRDGLKEATPHLEAAAASLSRMRSTIAMTIPIVGVLTNQMLALAGASRISANVSSSAFTSAAAAAVKANAAAGASSAGFAALLGPLGAIAAVVGVAYVALFKWDSVPLILKPILLLMSPLVLAIRAVATAWSVATLPVRIFTGSISLAASAITGLIKATLSLPGLLAKAGMAAASLGKSLASGIARGAQSALSAIQSFTRGALGVLSRLGSSIGAAGSQLKGLVSGIVNPVTDAAIEFGKAGAAAVAFAAATGLAIEDASALGYAAEKAGMSMEAMLAEVEAGNVSLAAMRREAQQLGLVLSGPQAAAATELTEAYAEMKYSLVGLWRTIGAAVAPQLAEAARQTAVVIKATTGWLAKNGPLIAQLFKVASTIATVGTGLATMGSVLAAATPGLIALTGAAVAGYAAWGRYGESIQSAFGSVIGFAQNAYRSTMEVMGGIWDALRGGDLEGAVEVAWAGALRAWVVGLTTLSELSNATFGGILNALASGEWRLAADQAWTAIQTVFVQGVSALDDVWVGLTNTIDGAITYLRQQINIAIREIARFGLTALSQANDVARSVAKYDPTGYLDEMRRGVVGSLNQSTLAQTARGDVEAINAGLAAGSQGRQAQRDAGLAGRQASRDEQLRTLGLQGLTAQQMAQSAATARDIETRDRLERAMGAAAAAREFARQQAVRDEDQRARMQAGATEAQLKGGGFGATFSASALMSLGTTAQERAAKAAEATLGRLDKLIALEQQRQKEQKAAELEFVA